MNLLLVEDDAGVADQLLRSLADIGHAVDHAGDGRDGLKLAQGGAYDVIILDRMLPRMDGLAVLRTLRKSAPIADDRQLSS